MPAVPSKQAAISAYKEQRRQPALNSLYQVFRLPDACVLHDDCGQVRFSATSNLAGFDRHVNRRPRVDMDVPLFDVNRMQGTPLQLGHLVSCVRTVWRARRRDSVVTLPRARGQGLCPVSLEASARHGSM